MAKVKVLAGFRDRENGLLLRKEDEVLEVEEERALKLERLGLAKKLPEEKKAGARKGTAG